MLRYLIGIVTSTFTANTGGCGGSGGRGGWDLSGFGGGCGSIFSTFPTTLVLYLSDLPSEALPSTSSFLSL